VDSNAYDGYKKSKMSNSQMDRSDGNSTPSIRGDLAVIMVGLRKFDFVKCFAIG
jgi:hypothetical protein